MPILVEKLSYRYMDGTGQAGPALAGLSLTVREGEFLGLIGETGSGKSTLVQHLNGLLCAQCGGVRVDGFDMADKKQRAQGRKRVGLVFQYPEYQLFEETVWADVAYGPRNMGLGEAEVEERVYEAMGRVGLLPSVFAKKSPFDLSGGEKRRAAIAGVLSMRPKYLVLDEPMAGLDPSGRQSILDMLDALREKTGCAIVMVSHSMDDMAKKAERIAVMRKGRIVCEGTPESVFSQGDMLEEAGLGMPQMAALAARLRKAGVPVPTSVYDMEGLLAFLEERRAARV